MKESQAERLKRNHIFLMKHEKTMLFSGIIVMGESRVDKKVSTAYTDGVNVVYGEKYLERCDEPLLRATIMHEVGHKYLRHLSHYTHIFREDSRLANFAADFVVNDIIVRWNTPDIQIGEGWLWNPMFRDWSVVQVYDYLKKEQQRIDREKEQGGGQGDEGGQDSGSPDDEGQLKGNNNREPTDIEDMLRNDKKTMDEHDFKKLSEEEIKKLGEKIDGALRQGGILAGILGGDKPRHIDNLLDPKIDWREVLREFVSSICVGKQEYSWRRYNRRMVANDIYIPVAMGETVGEIVVGIDTSGSIGGEELNAFATELVSICETVEPEKVRVIWWDAETHGEQVFQGNYAGLQNMLKPKGGGGTRVSCVSEYLVKENINAECVILFTDGHVESNIRWTHSAPVLWVITQNKHLTVPTGKKVFMDK